MKVFTYSEARQNLSNLLSIAQREEVEIRRRDGSVFSVRAKRAKSKSPFDVEGINTRATTQDILDAVSKSRQGPA
ncbi:MAG: prevent-host-death protein [Gammaproteobacteria bacterium]|nr:prevent-host-death protein [Gammaproteobacteria bacterium]